MKQILFFGFLVCNAILSFAQNDIYKQQLNRVTVFIRHLEQGQPTEAIKLIDSAYLSTRFKYLDTLKSYSKELSGYLKTTRLSIVGVYPEMGFNTFRCRYGNNTGDYFYIDLYMSATDPRSKVQKVVKVPGNVLEKDRKELAKNQEYQKKNGVPQPPKGNPPGVIIVPEKKN